MLHLQSSWPCLGIILVHFLMLEKIGSIEEGNLSLVVVTESAALEDISRIITNILTKKIQLLSLIKCEEVQLCTIKQPCNTKMNSFQFSYRTRSQLQRASTRR